MKAQLLCTLLVTFFCAAEKNLITSIRVKKNRLDVVVNEDFKKAYLRDDFFVEYDEDITLENLDYSLVTLPFILNVISLVWISQEDYYIDAMDQEVYESLERIKKVFEILYPNTSWTGRLVPRTLICHEPLVPKKSDKIALLFSGGVDSTSSCFAHRGKEQLLITAWGQSALPLSDEPLWHKVKKQLIEFAKLYGFTNAFMRSNYYSFLKIKKLANLSPEILTWRISTIEDIGWAGLIAPILIARGIPKLYIASSDTWDFPYPSAANPFIDGNIRFGGIRLKHDQFDMTRFDKISCIVKLCRHHFVTRPSFIVCQKRHGVINCGRCEKCLSTCLGLVALGENPKEYGFDLSHQELEDNMQELFAYQSITSNALSHFVDMQKKTSRKKLHTLDWFFGLDFSTKHPKDIKNAKKIDWDELHALFPAIKIKKKTKESMCEDFKEL